MKLSRTVLAAVGVLVLGGAAFANGSGWMANGLVSPPWNGSETISAYNATYGAGGFDVLADGSTVAQVAEKVNLYDATGAYVRTICYRPGTYNYGAFVRVDPTGTTVYVGDTTYPSGGGGIYAAALASDNVEAIKVADFTQNFDLEFANIGGDWQPLITGTNGGASTGLWVLDTTGANNHDLLVDVGGNSASFAVNPDGDIYVGTYGWAGTDGVLKYASAEWQAWVGASSHVADNGEFVTFAPGGLADLACDDEGNLVFNYNDFVAGAGTGCIDAEKNYGAYGDFAFDNVFAEGGHWITHIDVLGDVTAWGGKLFVGDFYNSAIGVAEVPEPSTMLLVASGLTLAGAYVRRRRA